MADAIPPNTVVDLSTTIGQVLIGTFIATIFWGVSCMQTVIYFVTYESDEWYFKALVIVLWLLDLVHEIFCIKASWFALIPKFGDLSAIATLQPEMIWQIAVTGVVATISHIFFIWRIWRFSNKNWIFPIFLIPATVGQMVGFIVYATITTGKSVMIMGSPAMNKLALGLSIVPTAIDVLIAVMMCAILWRSRTGLRASDRMIVRLMNASLSTGACTAFFGTIGVITVCVWPHDLFYALGEIPMCTLYCNAVLANLNSRKYLRGTTVMIDAFSNVAVTTPSLQIQTFSAPYTSTTSPNGTVSTCGKMDGDVEEKYIHYDEQTVVSRSENSPTTFA